MFVEPDCRELGGHNGSGSGISRFAAALFSLEPVLAGMAAAGLGIEALEAYLDYSRNEILDRLADLGFPVPHDRPSRRGGRNPWSVAEVRAFIQLWLSGIQIAAIAVVLGRSPGGIYSKRRRLGLPARPRKGQRDLSVLEIEEWRARLRSAAEGSSAPATPHAPAQGSEPAPTEAGFEPPDAPDAPSDTGAEQAGKHAADGVAAAAATSEPALSQTLPFAPGDYVVVPPYGVGRFDGIRTETVMGTEIEVLSIAIVNQKTLLKLAASRVAGSGLRKISPPAAADAALAALAMPANKGLKLPCHKQRVASCDLGALAEAVRDLWAGAPEWDWDARSLYQKALGLFAGEIAAIKNVSAADVRREIEWRLPRIEAPKSPVIEIVASDRDPEVTALMREIARRANMSLEAQLKDGFVTSLEVAARLLGGQKTVEIAKAMALTAKAVSCSVNRLGLGDRSRKRFSEFSRARADQYLSETGLFPRMCLGYRRLMFTDSPYVLYSAEYNKKSEIARRARQAAGINKGNAPKWKGISPSYAESSARLKADWEKILRPGRKGSDGKAASASASDGIRASLPGLEAAPA